MKEMTVAADKDNLPLVTAFINEILNENNCPRMTRIQLDVATDEIFSNIAKYAYDAKGGAGMRSNRHTGGPKDRGHPIFRLGKSL